MTEVDSPKRSTQARIGVVMMVLSCILWFGLFAVPFLPLTVAQRAAVAGVNLVVVQIAWWGGAALAGPEAVRRLKGWWRMKRRTDGDNSAV